MIWFPSLQTVYTMICNVKEDKPNISNASQFSQLILTDTPSTFRSTALYFHYNHSQIIATSIVTTNVTHSKLMFNSTLNDVSIYSLIPLLRIHCALRSLCVTTKNTYVAELTSADFQRLKSEMNIDNVTAKLFSLVMIQHKANRHVQDDTIFINIMVDFGDMSKTPMHIKQLLINKKGDASF
ncbi:unnamed protein product [Rotaria magnacalcarata]|uniref:Uncharacterized protein n=1 Tax=Rotaria magnacalcarata TaxID=392030 RepID=A0A8S2M5F3_9BILA|nr:unnamed protein product [Rotaria magnacalcarata]CAF3939621.1 unnamed protein product [Rotaria magnacalcarata]